MPRRSPMASRLIIRWGMPQAGNRAGKTINSLQCWDQIAERGLWTSAGGTVTTFRGHSNPNQNTIQTDADRVQVQRRRVPSTDRSHDFSTECSILTGLDSPLPFKALQRLYPRVYSRTLPMSYQCRACPGAGTITLITTLLSL